MTNLPFLPAGQAQSIHDDMIYLQAQIRTEDNLRRVAKMWKTNIETVLDIP